MGSGFLDLRKGTGGHSKDLVIFLNSKVMALYYSAFDDFGRWVWSSLVLYPDCLSQRIIQSHFVNGSVTNHINCHGVEHTLGYCASDFTGSSIQSLSLNIIMYLTLSLSSQYSV